jgi:hypothetical protein
MSGAIPPLPQYALMVWCSVKSQGQLYRLPFYQPRNNLKNDDSGHLLADPCSISNRVKNLSPTECAQT